MNTLPAIGFFACIRMAFQKPFSRVACLCQNISKTVLLATAIGLSGVPLVAMAAPPYPVIFIHGINGGADSTWESFRDDLILNHGWKFGGSPKVIDPLNPASAIKSNAISYLDAVIAGTTQNCKSLTYDPLLDYCKLNDFTAPIMAGDFYTLEFSSNNNLTFAEQGWELAKIIAEVKRVKNVTKVILVGHSMGGLAARAYLQGFASSQASYQSGSISWEEIGYRSDVAKLITVGTPHIGTNLPFVCQANLSARATCDILVGGAFSVAMEMLKSTSSGFGGGYGLNTNAANQNHGLPLIDYTSIVITGIPLWLVASAEDGDGIVTAQSQNFASLTLAPNVALRTRQILISDIASGCSTSTKSIEVHRCEPDHPRVRSNVIAEMIAVTPTTYPAYPGANTRLAANITSSSATLTAEIFPAGLATSFWFDWGVGTNPNQLGSATVHQPIIAGNRWVNVSQSLTGLASNTTYSYRVVAQNADGIKKGFAFSFTTPSGSTTILPAPNLIAPAQYAFDQSASPSFSWSAVTDATSYRIMVTTDSTTLPTDPASAACSACVVNITSATPNYAPPAGYLNPGTIYYWQVKGRSVSEFGYWSAPQQFTTAQLPSVPLPAPTITYPANGATTLSTTPGLSWDTVAGATSYRIMVARNATDLPTESWSLTCPLCVVNDVSYSSSYSPAVGQLDPGVTYYWQVKARSPTSFGAWSVVGGFVVGSSVVGTVVTPRIAGGGGHTVVLKSDGSLWTWGRNIHGQLGEGTTNNSLVPKQIGAGYTAVAAGVLHTAALKSDGSLWAWGSNLGGQLGDSTTINSLTPKQIGIGYIAIAAGGDHTVALKSDGSLWAWGSNWGGQLGDGTTTYSLIPKQIGIGYTAIAAGAYYTVALKSDGSLWAWGYNGSGQLGDGTTTMSLVPKQIGIGYTAITAGMSHTVALKSDGSLWAWGYNGSGQLGDDGPTNYIRPMPVQIGIGYTAIAAGVSHTVALKSDGSLWAWGDNYYGQLGDGTTTDSHVPKQIGIGYTAIAAGLGSHTVALKSDGSLWTWGGNLWGAIGDGTTVNKLVPTLVGGFNTQLSDTASPIDGTLSATHGNSQVALSWGGFSDTGSGIASYQVVASSTGTVGSCTTNTPIYSGTATSFTHTGLVDGTTYSYRVCAIDHAGNISAGALATATPQQVITSNSGSIRVSIVPQAAANLGAQWKLTNETTWRNSGTAASGLAFGTYSVEFKPVPGWTTPAVQSVPISLVNPDIWVDSGAYVPPTTVNAPSGLQVVVTPAGGLTWSWLDNSSNETVFILEQKIGGTGVYSVLFNLTPDTTSFAWTPPYGFTPGQQHCYRMRAYDGLLTYSGYSNEVCVMPSQVPVDQICAVSSPIVSSTAKIAAGANHTLSLRTDGTVWAWGANLYGQLGDGTTTDSTVPVQVYGVSGATAIAAGTSRSLVLKSDGTVWIWGIYTPVQQPNGTFTSTSTPIQVSGLSNVIAIAAGGDHNLALKADGTVWAWGFNFVGQLGNGTTIDSDVPVQVMGLTGVTAIAAGYLHSLALKTDGNVWVWGPNGDGSLGNGSTAIRQTTPTQVVGLNDVISLAAGYQYTVALKAGGTVWAWGQNVYGQMGTGTASPGVPRTIPAQVAGVSGIVALAAGEGHVLAVQTDGTVIGWGYNNSGQLGDGSTYTPRPLTPTGGLNSVIQVAAAWNQSIALKSSGHVCSWGSNTNGQLGSGSTTDRAYPAVAVEAGGAGYLNLISGYSVTDTTPPLVNGVSPAASATGIAGNAAVAVTFSEPMAASTVTTATFTLKRASDSAPVTGTVSGVGATYTFTPAGNLDVNTQYTATITSGVTDIAGNALMSSYSWGFTTSIWSSTLTGHVLDSSGAGMGGVGVNAYSVGSGGSGYATTAPDGSYSISLPVGTYTVNINKFSVPCLPIPTITCPPPSPSYYASVSNVNVTGSTIKDFSLPAIVTLSGKVSDSNGVGVANVSVAANVPFGPPSLDTAATGLDGTYSLTVYAGTYDIRIASGGTGYIAAPGISITADAVRNFTLLTSQAVLTGHVLNSNGTGVGGANVFASDLTVGGPNTSGMGTTAPDGSYSIPLLFGTYTISVNVFCVPVPPNLGCTTPGPIYSSLVSNVSVSGATVKNFALPPVVTLSGKVTDASGVGMANVSLSANGSNGPGNFATTGIDGTYSVPLYQGVYDIALSSYFGGAGSSIVSTGLSITADSIKNFTFSVPRVAVSAGMLVFIQQQSLTELPSLANMPPGFSFGNGFVSFSIMNITPGSSANVVLTLPTLAPGDIAYWVDGTGFHQIPGAVFDYAAKTVTFTVTDGGFGDTDGLANGIIVDPVGVGTPLLQDLMSPNLNVTSPLNGSVVTSTPIAIAGTASDAGQGNSGIGYVTVNSVAATGGTATGSGSANWSALVNLYPGPNAITVAAADGSSNANYASWNHTVIYNPPLINSSNDGLPDVWKTAHGISLTGNSAAGDPDGDGYANRLEYATGTDPNNVLSKPEGVNGLSYVQFRDRFDDGQYNDRWSLGSIAPFTQYALTESGTSLNSIIQQPTTGCTGFQLLSFATMDATNTVYQAKLRMDGYGKTSVGLMNGSDPSNLIELIFDNDNTPTLQIRSVDAGVVTLVMAAYPAVYRGTDVSVRLIKSSTNYAAVFVNHVLQGLLNNNGLGNVGLRPFMTMESCLNNGGSLNSSFSLVELPLDRDGDGLPDLYEDKSLNGIVDAGESDPLNPDTDHDGVQEGFDNCTLAANANQRDTNSDGYGNVCDPDLNNDGLVDNTDLGIMKLRFYGRDPDADLNGDGVVNFGDLAILKAYLGKKPGPSGLAW